MKEVEVQGAVQQGLDLSSKLPNSNETGRKLEQTLRENMDLTRR